MSNTLLMPVGVTIAVTIMTITPVAILRFKKDRLEAILWISFWFLALLLEVGIASHSLSIAIPSDLAMVTLGFLLLVRFTVIRVSSSQMALSLFGVCFLSWWHNFRSPESLIPVVLLSGVVVAVYVRIFMGFEREEKYLSSHKLYRMPLIILAIISVLKPTYGDVMLYQVIASWGIAIAGLIAGAASLSVGLGRVMTESEKVYQQFFRHARDIMLILRPDGSIIDANRAAEQAYGYIPSELRSMTVHDLRFAPEGEEIINQLSQAVEEGILFETLHRRKDGSVFWVEVNSRSLVLDEGILLVSVIRDITERKKIGMQLSRSRDHYVSILEDFPALIWRSDETSLCNYFNKSWLDYTGRITEQELGNGWVDGVHPDDLDRCMNTYLEAFSERKPFEMEYRLRKHDGSYGWLLDIGKPFNGLDGKFAGYIGSCYEITEQKNHQKEVHELTEKLRITLQSIAEGVISTNYEGQVVSMNRQAEVLTGYTSEEAIGLPLEEVFSLEDGLSGESIQRELTEIVKRKEPVSLTNNAILLDNNGSERAVEGSISPILDDVREVEGVVITFRDVTDKQLKNQLLRMSEEKYRVTFETTGTAMAIVEVDQTISLVNHQMEILSGYSREEIERKVKWNDLIVNEGKQNECELSKGHTCTEHNSPFEVKVRNKNGVAQYALCTCRKLSTSKQTVISLLDITERKQAEDRIRYLGYHDPLTGLHNRAYLEEVLKYVDNDNNLPLSIVMGDVNGLKVVNDALGHEKGDASLKKIADVMKLSCRGDDVISRWGGDEFIMILPKTDYHSARVIGRRIRANCEAATKNDRIGVSISLGIACKEENTQKLRHVLQTAEDRMYRHKLIEGKSFRSSVLASFQETLREKSHETEAHANRLKDIVLAIGRYLELPENQLDELVLLAALHDIGKIGIPDSILMKPEPLSDPEWQVMKRHSEIGYRIAKALPELAHIADGILYHHERVDGTGYPHGLKGDEIPLHARMISIADAFDVMTSTRCYKKPLTVDVAIEEIKRCSGSQFDSGLVHAFLETIEALETTREIKMASGS